MQYSHPGFGGHGQPILNESISVTMKRDVNNSTHLNPKMYLEKLKLNPKIKMYKT